MRIAYVCHWNLASRDGVAKKVEAQTSLWRAAGHDVRVFSLSPVDEGAGESVQVHAYGGDRSRLRATAALARAVRRFRPQVVYLRYDLFLPPVWALARLRPTVVEVNSDDRAEYRRFVKYRGRPALVYNEVNRRALLGGAAGLVYVTPELARSASFAGFRAPTEVVSNGVLFATAAATPPAANDQPRAVFLGSQLQAWHGVDRLAALARALPQIRFDIVGYDAEQLALTVPDRPANVHVHGRLAREEYEPLLAAADVGIGTLALHRKDMREAAPLKVREYLAAGLPVAIAYDDVDLGGVDAWWLLRLPNDETVPDRAAELARFVDAVRGRRVPRAEVAPLVSMEAKEERRLSFLDRVAAARARA